MEELLKNGLLIWGAILAGTTTILPQWAFYLTQFTKNEIDAFLDAKGKQLPTRYLAWGWSFILLTLALAGTGVADWRAYLVAPFVSVMSAVIAVTTHATAANDGAEAVKRASTGDDMADVTPKLRAIADAANAELAKVAGQ